MGLAKGVAEGLRSPVARGMFEFFTESVWQVRKKRQQMIGTTERANFQFPHSSQVELLSTEAYNRFFSALCLLDASGAQPR